ncbi:hypothetical protein BXZ70DRAFT_88532 [Cristinia sonorae]|uniref:Uncharacterized protein n=1 Tax=Cristinia sonorae TaxID=1940300 RepID=A0A8K0XQK6_9AGAR|nr:hypothetical protein BXZ70DRAFT_88532 [Cristinia sonorae]
MESHLLHAINVLQRDLVRAQEKLNAAAAVPMAVTPPPIQTSLPAVYSPTQSEDQSVQSESKVPSSARRPSTISLSSLQRPPFPHKLDLSSTILRLNPEDPLTSLQSGLASPVTLAPKSSISKYPPDLLGGSQHVDIDLTLDDDDMSMATGSMGAGTVGGAALGSSADKPIELDLDMDDIFGDAPQQAQVVSGASTSNISSNVIPKQEDTAMDLSLLSSVPTMGSTDISHGLMSFNPSELPPNAPGLSVPQAGQPSAPSPNSLLSGLQQPGPHNGEPQFDFDLNFLEQSDSMGMRMDDIFDMSNIGQPHSGGNSTTGN